MEIPQQNKTEIEQIMAEMRCLKDFECYKSELENLCKVEDIGVDGSVVCVEQTPRACEFSLFLEYNKRLCLCPLRVYIAKRFNR